MSSTLQTSPGVVSQLRLFQTKFFALPFPELLLIVGIMGIVAVLGEKVFEIYADLYFVWLPCSILALVVGVPLLFTKVEEHWLDISYLVLGTVCSIWIEVWDGVAEFEPIVVQYTAIAFALSGLSSMVRKKLALRFLKEPRAIEARIRDAGDVRLYEMPVLSLPILELLLAGIIMVSFSISPGRWEDNASIGLIFAISSFIISVPSAFLKLRNFWLDLLFIAVGVGVTTWILSWIDGSYIFLNVVPLVTAAMAMSGFSCALRRLLALAMLKWRFVATTLPEEIGD